MGGDEKPVTSDLRAMYEHAAETLQEFDHFEAALP
jgi:hypothetical protein